MKFFVLCFAWCLIQKQYIEHQLDDASELPCNMRFL